MTSDPEVRYGKVLVTGGTGTLGREVVLRLVDAGREVRVLSRHPRPARHYESVAVDLVDGTGLDAALSGVDTVVHCASRRHDAVAAKNLIAAAERAGVGHLVYISIVGVDRVPLRYYRTKLEVERLIETSELGWTILRTTQFHTLIARMSSVQRRSPVILALGGVSFQPIDAGEVATRLVELALSTPAGRVPDMGGPQIRTSTDLTRTYLRATGRRRLVVPIRLPGAVLRGYHQGGHLAPDHIVGHITFDEFLHP